MAKARKILKNFQVNKSILGKCLLGASLLGLMLGFVPDKFKPEIRLPYSSTPLLEPKTNHLRPLDTSNYMLRQPVNKHLISATKNKNTPQAYADLISFSETDVVFLTEDNQHSLLPSLEKNQLLQQISKAGNNLPIGLSFSNIKINNNLFVAECVALMPKAEAIYYGKIGSTPFKLIVDEYAKKYNLDARLIYAIMHTESGFNPGLVSNRFAHGLMQVVPNAAGGEVHAYLGQNGEPNTSSLLDPKLNIKYGITYLHLLLRRHMSGVENPVSREYCAIAAYNMGPTRFLKFFGSNREEAFSAINKYQPHELYELLFKKLPTKETRQFLYKVVMAKMTMGLQAGLNEDNK